MVIPAHIQALLDRMDAAGEVGYLVGGCLRDSLLGLTPHDFDIATSARPERTVEIFSDYRVIPTGIKHGTVTVIAEDCPVEITTFRIDGTYTDSRHPDSIRFADRINEDLARRDFTVNAMAYHPTRGLVDLFGGKEDLNAKLIRAVGNPATRFSEDALRILRAFRFSAQLGFSIHPDTLSGAEQTREGLSHIAKERITTEWLRLVTSPSPSQPIRQMISLGILPYITGSYTPSERLLALLPHVPSNTDARLGLLFAETSEQELRHSLTALKCSNRQITGALAVRRGALLTVASPKDAGRFRAATGCYTSDAIAVSVLLGHSPKEATEWIRQSTAPCRVTDLALTGRDLSALGFAGKEIGEVLSRLLTQAMEDPSLNRREILLSLAKQMDSKE